MARYRKIRKYENGWVIRLLNQDIKDLNIKEGDLVDIEDAVYKTSISDDIKKKFDEVENGTN